MSRRRGDPAGELFVILALVAVAALVKYWEWALVGGVAFAVVYFLKKSSRRRQGLDDAYRPPTAADDTGLQTMREASPPTLAQTTYQPTSQPYGWSYTPKQYFFARSEAAFFHGVRGVIPPDHHIFPKVRLSDLVDIDAIGRERWSAFGRVSQKHVDFVLCDSSFRPYAAIEVDGWSHNRWKQQESDRTKDRVLDVSGLPILRFEVGTTWDFGRIAAYLPKTR